MRMDRGLMAALRQLNLTPVQREQVRTIEFNAAESVRMKAATERQQQSAAGQQALDNFTVLANPGDPNYARAVQQLRTRATQRVQDSVQLAMDTEQKIYNVLTADQKAQLPKVLADTKTRMQQRINDVRARRQRGQGGTGGSPPGAPGGQPPR
jgi:Spy/CpxP family protein refolding chaperone